MNLPARIITTAAAVAVVLGGGAAALASTSSSNTAPPKVITACAKNGVPEHLYTGTKEHGCPKGQVRLPWNQTGPRGATGATGKTGEQGPSGVINIGTTDFGSASNIQTGGGFVANARQVGTVTLPAAGTYLITVNAKATPNATTSGDVFPQFFVYDQAKNSSFTGDLFNVGAGALEDPTPAELTDGDVIDSYFSGSDVITLDATTGTTLYVYAFGYDSDQGTGAYQLDDLSVTAVQVQASSS